MSKDESEASMVEELLNDFKKNIQTESLAAVHPSAKWEKAFGQAIKSAEENRKQILDIVRSQTQENENLKEQLAAYAEKDLKEMEAKEKK